MSSVVRQLRSYPQHDSSYDSRLKNPSRSVYPCSRFFENPLIEAEFPHIGLLIVHSCCWWVGVLIGVVWRVQYGGSGGPVFAGKSRVTPGRAWQWSSVVCQRHSHCIGEFGDLPSYLAEGSVGTHGDAQGVGGRGGGAGCSTCLRRGRSHYALRATQNVRHDPCSRRVRGR
jgi:hypothetical protein